MIYMIKKYHLIALLILNSCAFISYNQVIPLLKNATIGGDDIELTDEYVSQQPYSFIRVDLGKGANIIMVLQQIREGLYTWVSGDGEKIVTYNGKIIRTSGLIHNLETLNFRDFKYFSSNNKHTGIFNVMLKDPQAFIEQEFKISLIKEGERLLFEETINVDILNLDYSNFYWLDSSTGMPVLTKQLIHPMLPSLRIDFIYKY